MRKGRKVAKHCVFPVLCGSGGRKVGSLKRRVRSQLARWEMKNCTPLWREARFQVKSVNNWRVQSTLDVEMSKKCTPLWREADFEVKMYKTHHARTTFGSWDVEKVNAVVARSTFEVKSAKNWGGRSRCRFAWQAQGIVHLVKSELTWGFCSSFKNDGRRGTYAEDLQRCISRGRRNTRDIFVRAVRRSGRWFPEKRCILEHQIFSFGKMILRDRCSTAYDLASLFRGRRSTLNRWSGKTAKRWYEAVSSALNFPELSCCWRCHVQKLRKPRRIVIRFWQLQLQQPLPLPLHYYYSY